MNWKNMLSVLMMAVLVLACSKDDGPKTPDPIQQPDPVPEPEPQPDNNAPTADAGDDQKVIIGSVVKLNASKSSDPDGDALTFSWSIVSKPDQSDASLIGAGQSDAEFTMDKAGVYEFEVKVNDGEKEATDIIVVSNRPPVFNEVEMEFEGFDNITSPGHFFTIKGDFFSPSLVENRITVGELEYEITELEINNEGSDQDKIRVKVPEDAVSGVLKITVGQEIVEWNEVVRMASTPVRDFTDNNEHLERQKRSDGNNPDTYFEIGSRFVPKVNGQVLAFRLKMPKNALYRVTLWDTDLESQLISKTIETTNTGSSRKFVLSQPITLEKDKEYVISVNANDWYLHIDEEDAQGNQFPKSYSNIELISTALRETSEGATVFPYAIFPINYIVRGPDILFAADPE